MVSGSWFFLASLCLYIIYVNIIKDKIDNYENLKAEIVAATHKIPEQKVETVEEISKFFGDYDL